LVMAVDQIRVNTVVLCLCIEAVGGWVVWYDVVLVVVVAAVVVVVVVVVVVAVVVVVVVH